MVAESCLANLLQRCSFCGAPCESAVHFTRGTMIGTQSTCVNGHVSQWESQRCHNRMPWLNLLLSGAIVFTGINASKCLRFLKHLKIPTISASTFSRIQSAYTVPTAIFSWDFQQMELIEQCKDRTLILGGDARCDSPGFSAKFGSYTLMDLECGKVLDFQLVQCNEVASSTHMDLGGLKRGLRRLTDEGLRIDTLVTDRHCMIKKYMRMEQSDKYHYFDVWHMAKGVSKKLESAAKKKNCEDIRSWIRSSVNHCYWVAASSGSDEAMKEYKWSSLAEHVSNKHENCYHSTLDEEKLWLREGSRAHKLFKAVVENKFLLKDVSPLHQTYGLEVFHSVINCFAPKTTHFFFPAMLARLSVAALHFNENGNRLHIKAQSGCQQWQISYPKSKKGQHAVVKPCRATATYEYVEILRLNLVQRRLQLPSCSKAKADALSTLGYKPPPLTSSYAAVDKNQLIARRCSRFANQ